MYTKGGVHNAFMFWIPNKLTSTMPFERTTDSIQFQKLDYQVSCVPAAGIQRRTHDSDSVIVVSLRSNVPLDTNNLHLFEALKNQIRISSPYQRE